MVPPAGVVVHSSALNGSHKNAVLRIIDGDMITGGPVKQKPAIICQLMPCDLQGRLKKIIGMNLRHLLLEPVGVMLSAVEQQRCHAAGTQSKARIGGEP